MSAARHVLVQRRESLVNAVYNKQQYAHHHQNLADQHRASMEEAQREIDSIDQALAVLDAAAEYQEVAS